MTQTQDYYNLKRKILINLVAGGQTLVTVIVFSSFMKFYTDMVGLSPAIILLVGIGLLILLLRASR